MLLRENSDNNSFFENEFLQRHEITDRKGTIIATQIITASLYANPKKIDNPKEVLKALKIIIPTLDTQQLEDKLKQNNKNFVWIKRHLTPKLQEKIHQLGIPGLYLREDQRRVYPQGQLFSHVLGGSNQDNIGKGGLEYYFENHLIHQPIQTSLDVGVQFIIHEELQAGIKKYKADAANAIVLDSSTGEIIAMVSIPDFDLNSNAPIKNAALFNRNTLGVYEQGSTFKILNVALALELGVITPKSMFDASEPVEIGNYTIKDYRGKERHLSVVESLVYSSNVAMIKISERFSCDAQKQFLKKLGMLEKVTLELPEVSRSLYPNKWQDVSKMSISYGYGFASTPLHTISAMAMILNNGKKVTPTLLKQTPYQKNPKAIEQIIDQKNAKILQAMLKMVITKGTSKKAFVDNYPVIGKTGTAYQSEGKKGYGKRNKRTTSFIGGMGKYAILVMLDNPQGIPETHNFTAAGWNAAPVAKNIMSRIIPLLDVPPIDTEIEDELLKNYNYMKKTCLHD